jgi:hypothetical protein
MSRIQKSVAKWFGAFLLLFCSFSFSNAQVPIINTGTSGVTSPTGTTTTYTMGDDGHVKVPLQFGFPYFGKTFTNSVMYDNGVVGFFAPATTTTQAIGCDPALGFCGGSQWYSQQFTTTLGPSWNYMIAPLHSDLRPVASTVYSTTGDTSQMTYRWQNLAEYYNPSNLNTFSLQIKPSGFIGVDYEKINLGQSNVSVGLTGNLANNEYAQHYWKPAGTIINSQTNMIPNWNVLSTGADLCASDPLSSTSCAGYAQAYLNQQCTISALYNPSCPGYQQAYFTQQCAANPLYDVNCPGYATAYLNYQCSINPLYSTTCQGYEQAYFDQQCSISGLYNVNCPNYQQAYFADQCNKNGLYSTQCPNYATAYATWLALNTTTTNTTNTTSTSLVTTTTNTSAPTTTISSDGTVSTTVSATGDSNVDKAITTTTTTTNTAAAPAAPVQLTQPSGTSAPVVAIAVAVEKKQEEKKDATSSNTNTSQSTTTSSTETKTDAKPTARQELQARREAAAKARAVEDGKNLASTMGKAVDMEQQKMVQNVVIAAMGYTPGFDAYSKVSIVDVIGYKPFTVYNNQKNVDNRRLSYGLFGPTDRLHTEMVDSQYNR